MSCSFVEMQSEEVRKLAQACLDRIEKHKKDSWARQVAIRHNEYERSWWRRLRKLPVPSDEEILRELKGGSLNYLSMGIDFYGWGSQERAERLLRAAKHAPVVHVSAEDLMFIGA